MAKSKTPLRKPPSAPVQSVQFDLFTEFLTSDTASVSNAVALWDSIPKYFLTPKLQEGLRTEEGLARPYKWPFSYQGTECLVVLQPALLEQADGSFKAFFPSVTEELVEEALKKIFADQQYGIHDPAKQESWVRFTLGMISRELKSQGRTRSRAQIKHAILVMSRCHLTLYQNNQELYSGPILANLVTKNRRDYLEDSDSYHAALLPLFITESINRAEYRQFNLARWMQCDEQLTRWLYKRLVHRYRQASLIDSYHFMYSDVERSSGLLQQGRIRRNREKVRSALGELKLRSVLIEYQSAPVREGRKFVDEKYTVTAHADFIREQKAANKREKVARSRTYELKPVDKLM